MNSDLKLKKFEEFAEAHVVNFIKRGSGKYDYCSSLDGCTLCVFNLKDCIAFAELTEEEYQSLIKIYPEYAI